MAFRRYELQFSSFGIVLDESRCLCFHRYLLADRRANFFIIRKAIRKAIARLNTRRSLIAKTLDKGKGKISILQKITHSVNHVSRFPVEARRKS